MQHKEVFGDVRQFVARVPKMTRLAFKMIACIRSICWVFFYHGLHPLLEVVLVCFLKRRAAQRRASTAAKGVVIVCTQKLGVRVTDSNDF